MAGLFLPHRSDRQTFADFGDMTSRTLLLLDLHLEATNTHTHGYTQLPYTASVTSNHVSATPEVSKDRKAMSALTSQGLTWQLCIAVCVDTHTHKPKDHMGNQITCFAWVGSLISMDYNVNSSIITVETSSLSSCCLLWDEWTQSRIKTLYEYLRS